MNLDNRRETKYLIVLMGSIGDVVRALCLPAILKSHNPNCHITWLIEPKSLGILKCNKFIDEILLYERSKLFSIKGIKSYLKVFFDLRKLQFDITLDLQRHLKSGLFSFFSGSEKRIGFHRKDAKEFNWLFNNTLIPHIPAEHPKIQDYLNFPRALGIAVPEELDFGISHLVDDDVLKKHGLDSAKDFAAIVMGSSWESKDWTAEGYARLISEILKTYDINIALVGDKTQLPLANELHDSIKNDRLITLAGKTSLEELLSILGKSIFCIGPDSGPGHIAAALQKPYISLFGPTSDIKTAPYGSEDLVVRAKVACAPCYRRKCPGLNKICMRLININSIMAKIKQICD